MCMLPFFVVLAGVGIVGAGVRVRMAKKIVELTDRCRLTVQRCKFLYKVWSKCRNKENIDNLIRNGALDEFSDKIIDFMNCDTETIVNRLEIRGGIKGRARTKVMRTSLILLIEEIKKGLQRNLRYINDQKNNVKKYSVNPMQTLH